MRIPLRSLVATLFASSLAVAQTPTTKPTYLVSPDRHDALYKLGDPVTFHASTLAKFAGPVQNLSYKLTKDGFGPPLAAAPVPSLPATVTHTLTEPGVLRLELVDGTQTVATATAAISPEKIQPSLPPPDDFDAYWASQKQLLAADTPKHTLTPVSSPASAIDTYDLQINCPGGAPLSGYYAKPKDAKPKSLPAILYPHSAGVRSSSLTQTIAGAKLGCISLDFNAHGLPNGKPADFYTALLNGDLKGYTARGRESRDTLYFRGMFLRLLRALEFITAQPEWDGKTLIVYGSSQGGGQALVAAGLDPRVTLCLASVPALCDHTGFAAGRVSGWPKLVPYSANGQWNYDDNITQVARYFDAMNFAPRIQAETLVTVGLVDRTCPPTSIYAAYNAIPSKKRILVEPHMGHEFPAKLRDQFDQAVRDHLTAQTQKKN